MMMYKLFRCKLVVFLALNSFISHSQGIDSIYSFKTTPLEFNFQVKNNNLIGIEIENVSETSIFIDTTMQFNDIIEGDHDFQISVGKSYNNITLDAIDVKLFELKPHIGFQIRMKKIGNTNQLIVYFIDSKKDITRVAKQLNKNKSYDKLKTRKLLLSREIFNHSSNYIVLNYIKQFNFNISDITHKYIYIYKEDF